MLDSKTWDSDFEIIEPTDENENRLQADRGYGQEFVEITQEQLQALVSGKWLFWSDGEYGHVIRIAPNVG